MALESIKKLWALEKEEHENDTYNEIVEGVIFRGHNLWLLAAAMIIACIGLNAGNSAALIGAMLISPLMGPVIGIAFAISIQKRSLMLLSFKNWGIMVGTSLLASTLFFLITPFHYQTAELESFLKGTIFDVLLAFVGGIAGFIGLIRKEAIKVMAGVAVATACIPPLCTAGFGIANLDFMYFLGGFYFFLINCFFIGLGTYVTSKYLRYHHYFRNQRINTRKVRKWSWIIGLCLLLPSVWLAYLKWNQLRLDREANRYVESIRAKFPNLVIVNHKAYLKGNQSILDISLLNDSLDVDTRELEFANRLDTTIHVQWHFAPNRPSAELRVVMHELQRMDSVIKKQDSIIRVLSSKDSSVIPPRKGG
ncbi:MAG TPA: DUF389 domain-containing protein [Phnomibacter sp.]|nr:DUF389 domain-containing protein [Phnomibacter sp.]